MDEIKLSLPAKPEYVSVARLTASAVAARIGFDIDAIEDFKAAVSEAVIILMNQGAQMESFSWHFGIDEGYGLTARVQGIYSKTAQSNTVNEICELSQFIIESLMDKVEMVRSGEIIKEIRIYKSYGGHS
jgi:serine/threonine-protein kinase RsbW